MDMNKKILATGSIIACIILLVATLSPVVGYNTVRSSVRDSPLFSVRTSRATDKQSDRLTCDYVGKNIRNTIFFPRRNDELSPVHSFTKSITEMNENEFRFFLSQVISRGLRRNLIKPEQTFEIRHELHKLRENPAFLDIYDYRYASIYPPTHECCFTVSGPGCWLAFLFLALFYLFCLIIPGLTV